MKDNANTLLDEAIEKVLLLEKEFEEFEANKDFEKKRLEDDLDKARQTLLDARNKYKEALKTNFTLHLDVINEYAKEFGIVASIDVYKQDKIAFQCMLPEFDIVFIKEKDDLTALLSIDFNSRKGLRYELNRESSEFRKEIKFIVDYALFDGKGSKGADCYLHLQKEGRIIRFNEKEKSKG